MSNNEVKQDSKYWARQYDKYAYMIKSLERQLEETNAFTPEWEELYSLLLDTQEKLDETSYLSFKARHEESTADIEARQSEIMKRE